MLVLSTMSGVRLRAMVVLSKVSLRRVMVVRSEDLWAPGSERDLWSDLVKLSCGTDDR